MIINVKNIPISNIFQKKINDLMKKQYKSLNTLLNELLNEDGMVRVQDLVVCLERVTLNCQKNKKKAVFLVEGCVRKTGKVHRKRQIVVSHCLLYCF